MKKGFVFIACTCILWGASGLFVRTLSPYGFSAMQITALRIGISFLLLALYCLFRDRSAFCAKPTELLLYALSGIGLFGTSGAYFASMQLTSISTAVVLMYLAPVPVMIFSVLFLGERMNAQKGASVALMLLGCALVSGITGGLVANLPGVLMGLLAGFSYAGYNILTKIQMRRGCSATSATLYTFLFAGLFALGLCRPWQLPALFAPSPLPIALIVAALALFTCVLPYLLYSSALKLLPVGTASALAIIEPMSASLLAFIFYRESISLPCGIGIVLILTSVLLLGLCENSKDKKERK